MSLPCKNVMQVVMPMPNLGEEHSLHPAYAAAGLDAEAAAAKNGLPVWLHLLPLLLLHLTLFDCKCRYKLLPDFWWSRSTKSAPKPCEQTRITHVLGKQLLFECSQYLTALMQCIHEGVDFGPA
jgi:hypothetical protein